ncbi:MAG: NUDIX hydrolase [Candidatus Nomurabacteria bacterium]|nr:NUDIX hydrolase [Candidatus Nomurabacteria bacterium]
MKIPIVNEQDEIIRYEDRETRNPKDICRITGLWITDHEENILLAQRAFTKKLSPGLWGPAVAGTVEEGETYESNILKEVKEEIGLTGLKLVLGPKVRRSTSHEYFVQWFTAVVDHDYPFVKKDDEVESIRWFSKEEVLKLLEKKPEMFLANFKQYKEYFF